MKKSIVLTLLCLLSATAAYAQPKSVVMIVADDLREQDLQYMPSVQQLAAQGVHFTTAMTPYPLCTPSRASLLTGLSPDRHGVRENDVRLFDRNVPTLGVQFQSAGWRTAMFGKWMNKMEHLPDAEKRFPGWDKWLGFAKHTDYGRDQTKVLANRGADFLRDCRTDQEDCFLYLAPAAPHGPNYGPVECDAVPVPAIPDGVTVDVKHWKQRMSSICGLNMMVEKILRQNPTWVIFLSDNGFAMSNGKTGKNDLLFDAVRIPLVVSGPGVVHQDREEIVSLMDVHALAFDVAGLPQPLGIDGRSMLPLLHGSTESWTGRFTVEVLP